MNIKEVVSKKLYKEYSLEIPFEDIDKEINLKIQNIIPTVTIPGFRKGRAPINIVRKKYEDSILNEVIQNVVNLKTTELIKEKNFNLFRHPKVDLKNFEKNQPIKVDIKLDLQPEIVLSDFKDIKVNKFEINFSKKDLEDQYNKFISLQKNFKKVEKNRDIKKNDRVTINLSSNNEDVPEYLRSQKNLPVDTSIDQEILPEINKKLFLKKIKVGEKNKFFFDLSKILNNDKLNKVEFEIEVLLIEERDKFEVTPEFLTKNGCKNIDELKDILKKSAEEQYTQGLKQIEKKQLMDILNKNYNFDLPEGVLEEDFKEIWHRVEHAKKENSLDEDDKNLKEDQLKKRYKKISERRVKLGALLQFIAKDQQINISEDELQNGMAQYASKYPGQEKQIMEYLQKNPSYIESIKGPMLEDKIISAITAKSSITNKKINIDEYKKLEEETFDINRDKI